MSLEKTVCISAPMQNLTCKEVPSVTSAPSPCLRGVLSAPGAGLRPYVHEHDRCHHEPADGSGHCPPSGRGSRLRGGSRLPLRGAGPFREVTGSRYGAPASVVCMESTRLPFLRHSSSLGREPHCPGVASRRHVPLGHSALRSSPTQRRLSRPPARRSSCLCPDRNPNASPGCGGRPDAPPAAVSSVTARRAQAARGAGDREPPGFHTAKQSPSAGPGLLILEGPPMSEK